LKNEKLTFRVKQKKIPVPKVNAGAV